MYAKIAINPLINPLFEIFFPFIFIDFIGIDFSKKFH